MVARVIKYEEDPKKRRAIFRQRARSLKKSTFELSTLCDVPACIVIYNPEREAGERYKVWPKEKDKFRHAVDLYKKKGGGGSRASSLSCKAKKQNKQAAGDPEPRTDGGLAERLRNLTADQAMNVMAAVDKKIGEIQAMIDGKINHNMKTKEEEKVVNAGELMLVQGMDDDDDQNQYQMKILNYDTVTANVISDHDHDNDNSIKVADEVQVLSTAVVTKDAVFNVADEYFDFGAFDESQPMLREWQPQRYTSFGQDLVCYNERGGGTSHCESPGHETGWVWAENGMDVCSGSQQEFY